MGFSGKEEGEYVLGRIYRGVNIQGSEYTRELPPVLGINYLFTISEIFIYIYLCSN